MQKKNISKLLSMLFACSAVFTTVGCVSYSSKTTTTETVTDENGNTSTTTTETTTDSEGTTTKEVEQVVATVCFENMTGETIEALYFKSAQDEEWGDNILGETPMIPDQILTFDEKFKYSTNNVVWDVAITLENGDTYSFRGYDVTIVVDPTNITFEIMKEEAPDSYHINMK